jgi:hypothetical protein
MPFKHALSRGTRFDRGSLYPPSIERLSKSPGALRVDAADVLLWPMHTLGLNIDRPLCTWQYVITYSLSRFCLNIDASTRLGVKKANDWTMSDLAKLTIWDDPAVRGALSWYLDVAENHCPAKFRIAATVATQLEPERSNAELWAELDRLTPIFHACWEAVRAGASLAAAAEGASLLELCRELAYRMLAHCNFCPWNCRVDRVLGAKFGACSHKAGHRPGDRRRGATRLRGVRGGLKRVGRRKIRVTVRHRSGRSGSLLPARTPCRTGSKPRPEPTGFCRVDD